MLMKGCLHAHTICSDGRLTPQRLAEEYESRGYDFIAFTDHDYLLRPEATELYAAVRSGMLLFIGVELTVFLKGYIHVNRIDGDRERLHVFNHVPEYQLTPAQVTDRLAELEKAYPIDAVEITAKGFRDPLFEGFVTRQPQIASDDAHDLVGIGRAWIELDAPRDRDSIIRAVKAGDFWNCYL